VLDDHFTVSQPGQKPAHPERPSHRLIWTDSLSMTAEVVRPDQRRRSRISRVAGRAQALIVATRFERLGRTYVQSSDSWIRGARKREPNQTIRAVESLPPLCALGITTGCSQDPPLYCPTETIPRWEMAMFMIRARLMLYGASFNTSTTPYFADVPTNVEGNGTPLRSFRGLMRKP
jgi:hypothetical protein